jgi:hypothetical protein
MKATIIAASLLFGTSLLAADGDPRASAAVNFSHTEHSFGEGFVTGSASLADVTGDGIADILITNSEIANYRNAHAYVMAGDGHGHFADPLTFPVGPNPFGATPGDLDGDNDIDIVVPFTGGDDPAGVTVLINDGHGSFARTDYKFGSVVIAAAIADMDRDGRNDIVGVSHLTNSVFLLRGRGDGTFADPVEHAVAGDGPQSIAIVDVNRDGRLDIVTSEFYTSTVSILLATADGQYDASAIRVGWNPFAVVSGDFNRDGRPDLIAVNDLDVTYNVLLGNGDGTFAVQPAQYAGEFPEGALVADFNADGDLDFAIGNSIAGVVSIFNGRGDGTFSQAVEFPGGNNAYMLGGGDIDRDGDTDIVIANAGAVSILRNETGPPTRTRAVRRR